jgi:hypothetical protein
MSVTMTKSSGEGYSTASIRISQLRRLQRLTAILKLEASNRTTMSDALEQALDAWETVYNKKINEGENE